MATKIKALLVTAIVTASSFSAQAGTITVGGQALTNTDHFEDFEKGTPAAGNITNQFAADGLIFKTLGDNGIIWTSRNYCSLVTAGAPGNKYLAIGARWPCSADSTKLNAVSIMFAEDVSELSWLGGNSAVLGGYSIQALHDEKVVSETTFTQGNQFSNKTVLFTGSVFDEIRIIENGVWGGWFGLDNMAWNTAEPQAQDPSAVPLPGTAALFGIGMMGLGFMRKKKVS